MKDITPFHWFVIIALTLLVGFSYISWKRQQAMYAQVKKLKDNMPADADTQGQRTSEDKVTVKDFMDLISKQLNKREINITA